MKINKLLICILILGAILRLYSLGSIPPSLTPDEAALGYNAYSILKTAKDEHGTFLPVIFKSFGDNKPGLYIYGSVPFILFFGLNEFSVRLLGAISGILAIYLIYKIAVQIAINFQLTKRLNLFGILSAFVLATSPWHILLSRGAWEANLALSLILIGIFFYFKSGAKNFFLAYSAIFFSLSMWAYQGAKLSMLIVVLILFLTKPSKVINSTKKTIILSALLSILIAAPIIMSVLSGQASRLKVFSVFSVRRPVELVDSILNQGGESKADLNFVLFHSEQLQIGRGIIGRWLNHFSPQFLFFDGDFQNTRHSIPYHGMLYVIDIFLFSAGVLSLFRRNYRQGWFLLLWLLISPMPAVLSKDEVHAVRALNMVIPVSIIIALGAVRVIEKSNLISKLLLSFLVFGYLFSYLYFIDKFFVHLSANNSELWSYGYKQVVETITPIQNNYKSIYVQQSYAQPYIYFLFYQKTDPETYHNQISKEISINAGGDVSLVNSVGNVYFSPIDWQVLRGDKNSIVVGNFESLPPQDTSAQDFRVLREIPYLNKTNTAFRIVEVLQ